MRSTQALIAAIRAHHGVDDKSGDPYILHPIEVSRRVAYLGENYEVVALLHDVVEDTDVEFSDLRLDPVQMKALISITRGYGEVYRDYIYRVSENLIGMTVKLADLSHNLDHERMKGLSRPEQIGMKKRYLMSRDIIFASKTFRESGLIAPDQGMPWWLHQLKYMA